MSAVAASAKTGAGKSWFLVITGLVLALDQFTKYWVARALVEGDEIMVIRGFFKLRYTENSGIAFGLLSDSDVKWLLVAVSVIAIGVVVYYLMSTPASNVLLLFSLALLAAGISGNLIDRIRMGRVIDFILLYYKGYEWPVFNVADTAITIGAALMAVELFLAPNPEQATAAEPGESPVLEAEESPKS